MERFTYRSTSLIGLEAELRRNELLAEADRNHLARQVGRRERGGLLRRLFSRRRSGR